jgi:phage/plasmid-like protein (TIGR03299 family)
MTAFIEVVNGIGSFASARTPGWHLLGHTKEDGYLDMDEMLRLSRADYEVVKLPLTAHAVSLKGVTTIQSTTHAMTARQHPERPNELQELGIVGIDYKVFQPREAAEFGYGLLATQKAVGETAGVLHDGKRVFFSFRLNDVLMVGGRDPIATYLGIYTSHDGSIAYTAMLTDVRIVCQNTVNMALASAKYKWTLRHTKHADLSANKDRALEILGLATAYREQFAANAEKMISTTLTKAQFEEIITKEFGPKDTAKKRGLTLWEQQRDRLLTLFAVSETQEEIRNTAWAGYNAIVEYQDWYRTVPKVAEEDQQAAQFVRSVETAMDDKKAKEDPKAVMLRRMLSLAA